MGLTFKRVWLCAVGSRYDVTYTYTVVTPVSGIRSPAQGGGASRAQLAFLVQERAKKQLYEQLTGWQMIQKESRCLLKGRRLLGEPFPSAFDITTWNFFVCK
jgi:hypothetical protein